MSSEETDGMIQQTCDLYDLEGNQKYTGISVTLNKIADGEFIAEFSLALTDPLDCYVFTKQRE